MIKPEQIKNKDEFFERIIEENQDKIYRIICYYIANEDDRKDLYQETLINIWKGLDKFRAEAAISTWIFRITANTAIAFLSKQKANKTMSIEFARIKKDETDSEKTDIDKKIQILHQHISELPLLDMIIISMSLEEIPSKEIALITGLTQSNVRLRTHRIKENLKELMKGENS